MLLTLVLAGTAVAAAVVVVLAVVLTAVGCEHRVSLADAPATRLEAAGRRLLGVGLGQPEDGTRTIRAGRR